MGKKKINDIKRCQSFMAFNKSLKKKGKIKGKNKKETKILRGMCPHYMLSKKGKLKNMIVKDDNECICPICKKSFPGKFYDDDKIDSIVDNTERLLNQAKYISIAIGAGAKTTEYLMQTSGMLVNLKKVTRRLRDLARKKGNIKSKKKQNGYGSERYGSWSINNHR